MSCLGCGSWRAFRNRRSGLTGFRRVILILFRFGRTVINGLSREEKLDQRPCLCLHILNLMSWVKIEKTQVRDRNSYFEKKKIKSSNKKEMKKIQRLEKKEKKKEKRRKKK